MAQQSSRAQPQFTRRGSEAGLEADGTTLMNFLRYAHDNIHTASSSQAKHKRTQVCPQQQATLILQGRHKASQAGTQAVAA